MKTELPSLPLPRLNAALLSLLFAGLSGIGAAQDADKPEKRRIYVPRYGVDLEYMRLLSPRTRRIFGDNSFSFSPGLGPVSKRRGLSIEPDFNVFNARHEVAGETNKIFMLTAGAAFRYTLAPPAKPKIGPEDGKQDGPARRAPSGLLSLLKVFRPYAEIGIGLTYADITARSEDISGKRLSYSTSLAVGTAIHDRAFVQFQYRFTPKIMSFDMSSIQFEFGIRF